MNCSDCGVPILEWQSHCKDCYPAAMQRAKVAGVKALAECKAMLEPEPKPEIEVKRESPWRCEHEFINGICSCGTFEEQFWYSIKAPLSVTNMGVH